MQATDMSSLTPQARHERRVQVIRLRKSGYTYDEIAEQTGLSRTGVFNICRRHQESGAKALKDAPGGRKTGQDPEVRHQLRQVLDLLRDDLAVCHYSRDI